MKILLGFALGAAMGSLAFYMFRAIATSMMMTPLQLFWRVMLPAIVMVLALTYAAGAGVLPFVAVASLVMFVGKHLWY